MCSTVEENDAYFEPDLFHGKYSATLCARLPKARRAARTPRPFPHPHAGPACRARLILQDFRGLE